MLEVTILAILQGITEFLPVSSSGHLVVAQHVLGVEEPGMRLDIFLHLGTLFAIFAYYRKTVLSLVTGAFSSNTLARVNAWMYIAKIVLSALPACAVYFLFKDNIDAMFENARMVGALLMFTGAVLFGTRYLPSGTKEVGFLRALIMGCCQALALLPGVSRSGMTLAGARAGRVEAEKAAEFSFLMSAPLILGASILEFFKSSSDEGIGWGLTIYGLILSAIVGYVSLAILVRALKGRRFWLFGAYCFLVGLATLVLIGR